MTIPLHHGSDRALDVVVADGGSGDGAGLAELLERSGHRVRVARSVTGTLGLLSAGKADLLVLGLGLAEEDLLEVAAAARRGRDRPARLIALAAADERDDRERARRLGFEAVLARPFDPARVRELVSAGTAQPEPEATPEPEGADGEPSGSLLVLVVERDPHVRELEAHFLRQAGYSIEFAADGHDALEQARRLRPDVVITEILVPKLDGLALCRQLKADPATRAISVLVFSILAASGRAKEAGADAFLTKPLAERRLVSTVQSLLAKRPSAPIQEQA